MMGFFSKLFGPPKPKLIDNTLYVKIGDLTVRIVGKDQAIPGNKEGLFAKNWFGAGPTIWVKGLVDKGVDINSTILGHEMRHYLEWKLEGIVDIENPDIDGG